MEMNESSAKAKEVPEEKTTVKKVKVRCHLFFDGTLNNRTNIEQRLLSVSEKKLTEEEREEAIKLKNKYDAEQQRRANERYDEFGSEFKDEENSYEGYYTNIVLMDRYADDAKEYDVTVKAYVEGSGTLNMDEDKTKGFAFAKGKSGVKEKVEKGLDEILTKIQRNVFSNVIIEKITIDVFGFSRGAASARYSIHQGLHSDVALNKVLTERNYQVNKVEVCFAGLFDTVSTYGYSVAIGLANNVSDLKLNAVSHAKQTIHLTAADEHRKYFSLTNIKSAGGKGKEFFLPGVHSDIGGGYRDNATEKLKIFKTSRLSSAENEKKRLIELGWYQDKELDILKRWVKAPGGKRNKLKVALVTNRENILNHYSKIPLHIMVDYAKKNKIRFKRKLGNVEKIPTELDNVKQEIDQYISSGGKSKATDWHSNDRSWLLKLRHDYFHFSARYKIGHDPRFSSGRRYRKVYNG